MSKIIDDQEYYTVKREWLDLDRTVYRIECGFTAYRKPFLKAYQERLEQLTALIDEYDAERCKGRIGKWIPTFTGKRFWLLDPRPQDIDIRDIAHNLAKFPRYAGGTKGHRGYSVAQHSVACSYHGDKKFAMAKLMHDSPEAYMGDCISPLKDIIRGVYEPIEHKIMLAVAARFGFEWDPAVEAKVKESDMALLTTEVRDLVPTGIVNGRLLEMPLPGTLRPMKKKKAEKLFLARFNELYAETQV